MKYNYKKIIAEAPVVIFRNRGQSPEVISKQQVMVYVNAILHRVVNETGDSSDDVMSQAAVTNELNKKLDKPTSFVNANLPIWDTSTGTIKDSGKSLNDLGDVISGDLDKLEAKLNENIIKNPDYTYIVVNATSLDFSNLATKVEVDWGDGTTGSQGYGGSANNIIHTYTDGVKYHLVTIKKLEDTQAGWAYAIGSSGIEAYIGTKTENFFNSGPDSPEYYSNLKRVVYAEGINGVILPAMVKEPVIIPESCVGLQVTSVVTPPSSNITIPKIIIQSNKLLERPITLFTGFEYIGKIVVPKEYINAYKTATGWSAYADKIVYEVDSGDLEDKVSKFTDTSSFDRAYVQNSNGQDSAAYIDGGVSEYSLIRRNAGGTAKVAKGVADDDIANLANLKDINVIYVSNSLLGE